MQLPDCFCDSANSVKRKALYVLHNQQFRSADDFRSPFYTERAGHLCSGRQRWQTASCFGGQLENLLTPLLLKATMPKASDHNIARFAPDLIKTLTRYSIMGPLRTAHFLAQVAQESGQLAFTEELASGVAYEGRSDLGNVEPGDGARFKGRGLIQITGRSNYRAYSHACGQELLSGNNPCRIATDAALATDVAGWFWQTHQLNALADNDDIEHITRRINGGLNGLTERQTFLVRAKAVLEHTAERKPASTPPGGPTQQTTSKAVVQPSAAAAVNHMRASSVPTHGTRQLTAL